MSLFTDKYKPKKYTELLTEEKINREVLTWMKSWDEIVFGKKFVVPKIPVHDFVNKNQLNKSPNEKQEFYEVEYVQSKHKVILLTGPPGVGKTTLACIVAEHCGYEPIVINASDERTADKLLTRIYDITLFHKVNQKKPTCLILDEIDGIAGDYSGKGSIKNIINFIKSGKINKNIAERNKKEIMNITKGLLNSMIGNSNINFSKKDKKPVFDFEEEEDYDEEKERVSDNSDDENGTKPKESNIGSKKVIKKQTGIKRPIICICNDIYARSLTLLRKEALVYNLRKTDEKKMLDKLYSISQTEHLPLDKATIKNICELTKYDIRASLNCLQFISYNKHNKNLLSSLSLSKLSFLGNKDINENLFNVWNKIFFTSRSMPYNETKALYNSNGEHNRIVEGLFSNYLKIPNKDSLEDVEKRAELTELFSYEDKLLKQSYSRAYFGNSSFMCMSGNFIANKYSMSKFDKNVIEYPTMFYDIKNSLRINTEIISNLKSGTLISSKTLITQLIPYLYQLLQPEFREINRDLMNKNEQLRLSTTAHLMIKYGIVFKQVEEKLRFEPDITRCLNYEKRKDKLTENMKMLIKMEIERIKRNQTGTHNNEKGNEKDKEKLVQPNNLNAVMRQMGKKRKFDQFISPEYKFIYKFHEGVTNCVRRSLNVNYFFETK